MCTSICVIITEMYRPNWKKILNFEIIFMLTVKLSDDKIIKRRELKRLYVVSTF
jgi:hypothetical protein